MLEEDILYDVGSRAMIKVSIHYPNRPDGRFDMDYYLRQHMPLALDRLGPAIKGVTVDIGTSGTLPDQAAPYVAICHFLCETVQDFYAAFLPNAEILQGDMPHYTNIDPIIQVSDVRILK